MKKYSLVTLLICLVLAFAACSEKEAQRPDSPNDNSVVSNQGAGNESNAKDNKTVITGSEADGNRAVVSGMLDCFIARDYEGALLYIRESDRSLLDFSNTSQMTLYDSIFSRLSYELRDVYTSNGRTFVEAEITAPDMLHVYSEVNLRYLDAMLGGQITSADEARDFNNQALVEVAEAEDLELKTMPVDIELMTDNDGENRIVFTAELMNAMLGDIQNAQAQISEAIQEGTQEYTAAKESGAFD